MVNVVVSGRSTGKLPYVTWQKLRRDRVPMDQWPQYAVEAYRRFNAAGISRAYYSVAAAMPGANKSNLRRLI